MQHYTKRDKLQHAILWLFGAAIVFGPFAACDRARTKTGFEYLFMFAALGLLSALAGLTAYYVLLYCRAPHGRWFEPCLRTGFALALMLSLFLTWLTIQLRWIRERHVALDLRGQTHTLYDGPPAPWSLRVLGEQGVRGIAVFRDYNDWGRGPELSEADRCSIERLESLFP